jgi:Leucine-rich repeat (LRR) protein
MKRIVQIFSVIILGISPIYSQNMDIPDGHFLNALLMLGVDTNEDGLISYAEAEQITALDLSGGWEDPDNISNMKGIEAFVNLETLDCSYNQLTSLDVSNNTALTSLDCGGNLLTSLDVTSNTALEGLYCGGNQLTSLNVSNNNALTRLSCGGNQFASLDVSNNTALRNLDCSGPRGGQKKGNLTSLDVSNNTALRNLDYSGLSGLQGGGNLTSLDITKNTSLEELVCNSNQLTSLEVSNNTALLVLSCWGNQLTSLDVSNNTALQYLDIGMPSLRQVCVWTLPFPPEGVYVSYSPIVYFTSDCSPIILIGIKTLYDPDHIEVASSQDGMIYLVPEGTEKDLATICAACLDSAVAVANISVDISLDGFDNGEYWLFARDESGTLSHPKPFTIMGVGIDDNSFDRFRIYPNPVNEVLTIQTGTKNEHSIQITTLNGQLIYGTTVEGDTHRIDMSPFSKGVYLIRIRSEEFVTTRKVIKL